MSETLLLGIDVGTTNCKAVVFDRNGRQLAHGRVPTPVHVPRPTWAEHDAESLWQAVVAAVRQALATVDAGRVRGVAVASMAEAGVLLDAAGAPLSPFIAWYDGRTAPQFRWWREHIPPARSYALARLSPKPIFSAFKLLWLRDNRPEAYRAAARWLHVADYIAFRLCGAAATDYSLASRTLLFDLEARRWSEELCALAGLRIDLLAPPVQSGTPVGEVTAAAAEATGLRLGVVVAAGGHDHVCGALAAGVRAPGDCLDSMGTADASLLPLDHAPPHAVAERSGGSIGAHVARGRLYAMSGVRSAGAATGWASRLLAGDTSGGPPRQLEALASGAPPGSHGAYFLPRLNSSERGGFAGLTTGTDNAALARAVYEGLCYDWRRLLEQMETAFGTHAPRITVIGGGGRSALWTRIKADVLNRPLDILEIDESVALGAALLAGLAAGVYRDEAEAASAARQVARAVAPDAEAAAFYDRRYREVFLRLHSALNETHAAIDDLERSAPESRNGAPLG